MGSCRAKRKVQLEFSADSEAIITKGIAAILHTQLFQINTPKDIDSMLNTDLKYIDEIGLKGASCPQLRANGLVSMIKQMKYYALAYSNK